MTTSKSTALYPHPFSRAYWRDAAAEMKSTRTLVLAALMIALRVATKGLAVPIAPNLKLFSVASFINALGAMMIGPVMAIPAAFISDFLGVLIWEGLGTYFLPYALQEIASSLIWALLLYRAKVTPWRVMLGRLGICVIVNVVLGISIDMLYQQYYYGASTVVLTIPRILKNTFMFPIEAVAMTFFLRLMVPITNRMGLTYGGSDSKENLSFGKKQVALLAVLFVVGVGCVTGYLFYYYDTTSITTGYTTQEQADTGKAMYAIICQHEPQADDSPAVAIIDSAYRPFLSHEVTYNISFYQVDPAVAATEEMESLWALKKTPASKHEALTKTAAAIIVRNERTGEVLSYSFTPVD